MEEAKNITIKALDEYSISVVNEANNPFPFIGKIIPSFSDSVWTYEEQLYEKAHETSFPDDLLDWSEYINSEDKQVFLAFDETSCIGQIRVVKDWNRFAYIENISVRNSYRHSGIGHLLMDVTETWAKEQLLLRLSLEAQNDNVIACRFYAKERFVLGGVDTLKQIGNPNIDMTLYWYKIF
ncbi:GNAT family N-acetyltransferase [Exiguobacterium sp. SL-10]|uniref:GNAT family N-acetyltransferase n=1 Tax=Exiguobacterium sp. SL-10 TaxID=2510962 RepID=UPI00103F3C2E|nr:GNAT family N-acetyltransferase [Exiguobacterium sp. SL-10]TCI30681.1 GNAT family N-acetyltransferase [Exiguobacterium sp. SL-10]